MLTGTLGGLTHNMSVNFSAITPIPGAVSVSLSSAYNLTGLVADGAVFSATGGLDGAGNAYSATLLGSAPNWNGCLFAFGPAGAPDAVAVAGQTIALPAGQYTGLLLLGAAINASQPNQTFEINYTDGTSVTLTQSISLWTAAQNYSGESVAMSAAYSDTSGGTAKHRRAGQSLRVCPGSERLQERPEHHAAQQQQRGRPGHDAGQRADGGLCVRLQPHRHLHRWNGLLRGRIRWRRLRLFRQSARASQIWDSVPFKFGPANANDVVKCAGQTVALPANRYTTLLMLAAAVDGSQASQTFTLTYTDGTTTPIVQSLSDWVVTRPIPTSSPPSPCPIAPPAAEVRMRPPATSSATCLRSTTPRPCGASDCPITPTWKSWPSPWPTRRCPFPSSLQLQPRRHVHRRHPLHQRHGSGQRRQLLLGHAARPGADLAQQPL